jgi:hypothetical protein
MTGLGTKIGKLANSPTKKRKNFSKLLTSSQNSLYTARLRLSQRSEVKSEVQALLLTVDR